MTRTENLLTFLILAAISAGGIAYSAFFSSHASAATTGADLRVDVASSPLIPASGENATVRVRVRNNGPEDATNVSVTIGMGGLGAPSSITPPAGWSCSGSGPIVCTTPLLKGSGNSNRSGTVTFVAARVGADAYAYPDALASSDTPDPVPGNNYNYARATLP